METTKQERHLWSRIVDDESSVQARLIRDTDLAGELLEALEAVRPYLNGTCNDMAVVEGADEAIAKAHGEAQDE